MANLVTDKLWAEVAPLLPAPVRSPRGGAPRTADDRACLGGILYVLELAQQLTPAAGVLRAREEHAQALHTLAVCDRLAKRLARVVNERLSGVTIRSRRG